MFKKIAKISAVAIALSAPSAFASGMMGMGGMGMGMGGMGMMGMGMSSSGMIISSGSSSMSVPVGTVMFSGDFDDRRVIGTSTGSVISSSGFDADDRRVIVNNGLVTGTAISGDGDDFRRATVGTRSFRRFDRF